MHIGTARTALFNWLIARSTKGEFLLRIDDTNKEKSKPEYVTVIIDTMKWLGLDYDKIVYQSDRFVKYQTVADDLVETGLAEHKDGGIVLTEKAVEKAPKSWKDEIAGDVAITDDDLKAAVGMGLIKKDGSPAYNFATVVDDVDFYIDIIVRATDHISNTARQVILFSLLDDTWANEPVKFAHIGLIHQKGKKLSKSDGAASMLYYRDKGYDPDAMFNFLLRMGWGPKVDDKTVALIDRAKALDLFMTGGTMRAPSTNMDLAKLESYDRKYKARKGQWRTGEKLVEEAK